MKSEVASKGLHFYQVPGASEAAVRPSLQLRPQAHRVFYLVDLVSCVKEHESSPPFLSVNLSIHNKSIHHLEEDAGDKDPLLV